ncbi:cellulose-binding domain-containing protein [Streptosporangium sp. NBC_01755]|uniref:cellulose binding domain-containing protein n=1 Tax=unclassified Streptosporangium TaxID=2632669 RepID=UPI002DDB5A8F|nr:MULTISPECIES: cellulose binding domain-containing protein [unclassified Streptosporangium]WSA23596.1 cellulose-binding domain-containing protein [Streptosporangium sp. NBC_01810]WSC98196.1 cellulose-binding domain-containing protein [Streptosporangium sp. NBC_01755]
MKLRAIARSLVALAARVLAMTVALPAQAASPTAVFTKVSDWGAGFEGKYTITNGGTTTINGWSVAFDLPAGANIGSFWDASMSRSGQRFTFTNVGWNGTLAPGATASFGFNGSPGGATPSNCTLNGAACGGGTNPGTPGAPGTPSVTGTTNSSISLSVRLRRLQHLHRHRQRLRGPEERAEGGQRLDRRAGVRPDGHLRHERSVRPAGADHGGGLDPDPRLGQVQGPDPPRLLGGQPRPTLPGGGVVSNCSGIAQSDWDFTRVTAGF